MIRHVDPDRPAHPGTLVMPCPECGNPLETDLLPVREKAVGLGAAAYLVELLTEIGRSFGSAEVHHLDPRSARVLERSRDVDARWSAERERSKAQEWIAFVEDDDFDALIADMHREPPPEEPASSWTVPPQVSAYYGLPENDPPEVPRSHFGAGTVDLPCPVLTDTIEGHRGHGCPIDPEVNPDPAHRTYLQTQVIQRRPREV